MKLVYKFALWYLVVAASVFAFGGIISYNAIKAEIDFEQAKELRERIDHISKKLAEGRPISSFSRSNVEILELDPEMEEIGFTARDTLAYHAFLQRMELQLKVSTSKKINGRHYYISVYDALVQSEDITSAVTKSLGTIFIILLVITGLLTILISKQILSPFNKTLRVIKSFRLREKTPVHFPATRTSEFKKLNLFLESMTKKAQQDYRNLKEFTENASHEMQTPLSIIRGKLELLMESEINDSQAKLIMSAHNAVEKLSKMGQSLILLTKLENHEFETPGTINFSRLLTDSLFAFEELIEMKSITLEQEIADNVQIAVHPVLADILLSNLLSNAIRHNKMKGFIKIELTEKELIISNTGDPLEVASSEIFKRFKKGDQSNDSVGLGLAIVKQICEQNNIHIQYNYEEGKHRFHLIF